jgi:hypothetical protein
LALGAVADLFSDALQAVSTSSVTAMAAPPKRVNLRVIPGISLIVMGVSATLTDK